jgi:hypothetical protein
MVFVLFCFVWARALQCCTAGLDLLDSSDPSASASPVDGTTRVNHQPSALIQCLIEACYRCGSVTLSQCLLNPQDLPKFCFPSERWRTQTFTMLLFQYKVKHLDSGISGSVCGETTMWIRINVGCPQHLFPIRDIVKRSFLCSGRGCWVWKN